MRREQWQAQIDYAVETALPPSPADVVSCALATVAERHGVEASDIVSPSRKKEHVAARVDFYRVMRAIDPPWSYPAIARAVGRDSSSVIQTLQSHERVGARSGRRRP